MSQFLHVGLAFLVIVVLTGINILGVHFGKHTQNFLTVLNIIGLAGILVTGLWCARTWQVNVEQPEYKGQTVTVVEGQLVAAIPHSGLRLRDGDSRK